MKQILIALAVCMLIPLQLGAEQVDAWTRSDAVMQCEVVRLERKGLRYATDLLSHYDGIVRPASVSLAEGWSLAVGDVIPCAMVYDRLILIKGYDTELYKTVSKYKIEPLTVPAVVGVKVTKRG